MSLSCTCGEWDGDGWYYVPSTDYTTLQTTKRHRCCSCETLIELDAIVTSFQRFRGVQDPIEERIYGEDGEVRISTWYMCETCSDLYFSLDALGFCINLGDSMHGLVEEYHDTYGR
jgi:hypothetical protein